MMIIMALAMFAKIFVLVERKIETETGSGMPAIIVLILKIFLSTIVTLMVEVRINFVDFNQEKM